MSRYTKGNHVTLLRNGEEYFPALEAAIDGASHEVHLQTYIYEADAVGQRIGAALKRAASREVAVCLLLDGFGSKDLPKAFVEELQAAGVNVMFYRPKISPWTFKRNRLRRLHCKLAVIDGRIAFVGGINIIDDFNVPGDKSAPRIDYAVRVEGKLLNPILSRVRRLWRRIALIHLLKWPSDNPTPRLPASSSMEGVSAAFLIRDNVLHRRDIEHAYLAAIARAKSEIIIANAYFLPGRHFRHALISAARRGVRVRLLLQGRMEYLLMFATHSFYSMFLGQDIEIYEYHKSFMHSKVAVIDSKWATIGSSNIDPFSLLLAREANVVVQDEAFATELRLDIERKIQEGASQIKLEHWKRGHIFKRVVSWAMYGVMRLMLGLIGYPNKH
jgi:cardiolipin synthase